MNGRLPFHALAIPTLVLSVLSGCGPSYSPDTYSANAVQQANKVEQGVIIGVRDVGVSAAGTVGTLTGAAAGGIAGSQLAVGPASAMSALGGSLVGGLAGSAVEHASADTTAFEYIVRKTNGDLVSVTQRNKTPLALGEKVLVIAGNQARVVPDYTVSTVASNDKAGAAPMRILAGEAKPAAAQPSAAPAVTANPLAAAPTTSSAGVAQQAAAPPQPTAATSSAPASSAEPVADGKT